MITIPRCADLASDPLPDPYDDMINPPGLTNLLGAAGVDHDVHAVRSVSFPPYSQGDVITGQLYLDGRLVRSHGGVVTAVWRPDRVTRSIEVAGLAVRTETICVPGEFAVAVRTELAGDPGRTVGIGLSIASGIVRAEEQWHSISPQAENSQTLRGSVVIGTPADGSAAVGQAVSLSEVSFAQDQLTSTITLDAAGRAEFDYVQVLGGHQEQVQTLCTDLLGRVPELITAAEQRWDEIIAGVFDHDSDEFSGALPILETDNETVRKLYWWGIIGLIWFRRDNPASVIGRTYDTLSPRHWQTTTFIWDYSLSSLSHALLDPEVMRRHLEHWVDLDIHSHFGTSWLTGGPVGYWYSVNDFAMTRLVRDYLRCTGERGFLDAEVGTGTNQRSLRDHLDVWVHAWQGLRGEHELADYGGIDNLMECVSSYIHEVASLNAANVWCLRSAAEIADLEGRTDDAASLRAEADELIKHVQQLYVPGKGFWHARQPDGRLVEVRHCYDFTTVGTLIAADLEPAQAEEMTRFFTSELQTPTWMRALSPYDPDAAFSVRPDHQWNGAYPAWPADAARALFELGRPEVALDWLPGLAKSANQGPCGQAHFVEEAQPPLAGGARKSPAQFPYLIDWSCSSSGAWIALILEGVFGIRIAVDGTVTAAPQLGTLDPNARLTGLFVQGREYTVDTSGAHLAG
jgi:hypothetical protein